MSTEARTNLPGVEEVQRLVEELDDLWSRYKTRCSEAVKKWEKVRINLVEKIAMIKGTIASIEKEIEDLYVKTEIGLISPEKAAVKMDKLGEEKGAFERGLREIRSIFEELEKWSRRHVEQARLSVSESKEIIENKIEEIRERAEKGEISKETAKEMIEELRGLSDEHSSS